MFPLMFGTLGAPELAVIFLILLLIFGGSKIPKLASALGETIRNFKRAIRPGGEDDV